MYLSNYNLFSFLVPEGEVLGNQTILATGILFPLVFTLAPFLFT